MFATSAMQYMRFPPLCGYGVALNVDCKTMRLCRGHFSYCHAFHTSAIRECTFLHLYRRRLLSIPPLPPYVCVYAIHIFYFVEFLLFFLSQLAFPRQFPTSRIGTISLHSISKLPGEKKRSMTTTATELNLGSTVRDLFYPPLH